MLRTMIGLSAILLAAIWCYPVTAQDEAFLPANDPNPNIRLMRAIWRQDHDAVAAALKSGAIPNYIAPFSEFRTHFGGIGWSDHPDRLISALDLAARLGDLGSMDLIVEAGADINLHARAQDTSLPAGNSSLTMPRKLIQKGYRPTAQDITSAMNLQRAKGWEEWSTFILNAPGIPRKAGAIRAGTDPDYQKFIAEQDADRAESHQNRETYVLDLKVHPTQDGDQEMGGGAVGQMVCSKSGVYRAKYVAWIEKREQDRVLLKIAGSFNGKATDFRPLEMRWDDIEHWTPCSVH